jgi:hypothetical protein
VRPQIGAGHLSGWSSAPSASLSGVAGGARLFTYPQDAETSLYCQ